MSGPSEGLPGRPAAARADEERLLELLLAGSERSEEELEELRGDPRRGAAAAELEAFLATCRHALREAPGEAAASAFEGARGAALAERVLDRSTREDLGWRGDLRLLGGFAAERLRSSRLLRLAAASLLVHLAALPVLAWYALLPPRETGLQISIEPRAETPLLPEEAEEPVRELAQGFGADPLAEGGPWPGVAPELENNLRQARYWLAPPQLPGTPPQSQPRAEPRAEAGGAVARLLAARARLLRGEPAPPPATATPAATGALERALDLELQLDRYVLRGERGAPLERALAAAARPLDGGDPGAELLELALARAESYGLAGPWNGRRPAPPLSAAWFAALERAVEGSLAGDATVAAWLAWGAGPGASSPR